MRRYRKAAILVLIALAVIGSAASVAPVWTSAQQTKDVAQALTGGDASRAPELMRRYGCGGCHTIDGIPGADGQVGGPLKGLRQRVYIGGAAFNSPDNLVKWIVSPQTFSPRSAMPATGISPSEARDVAAYLYAN